MKPEVYSEFVDGDAPVEDYSDRYEEIGRHGFVVMGRLVRHGQIWFVKSFAADCGMAESNLRLRKEYEILLKLNHPGVVRAGWLEELPEVGLGLIMEMAEGETLDRFLKHASRTERRQISDSILRAVAYIHSSGVCHLDLKPQNILVAGHGRSVRIKIVDFGMSDSGGSAVFKSPGGTRGFSDPEQFKPGYEATPRSDVYAVGRLLEMIDGGRAYRAAAKISTRPQPTERPADGNAVVELVERFRSRRILVCLTAACLGAAGLVALWLSNGSRLSVDEEKYTSEGPATDIKESPMEKVDTLIVISGPKTKINAYVPVSEPESVSEYDRLVAEWNIELENRLGEMKKVAQADTVERVVRREILEKMYEQMVEDTREFFRSYIEQMDEGEVRSHPLSWASIYDPVFADVLRRMTAVYEAL